MFALIMVLYALVELLPVVVYHPSKKLIIRGSKRVPASTLQKPFKDGIICIHMSSQTPGPKANHGVCNMGASAYYLGSDLHFVFRVFGFFSGFACLGY